MQPDQPASDDDMHSATKLPATSAPAPVPCRSERIKRKPGPWWPLVALGGPWYICYLVDRKPHMNVIRCRYVFRVKRDVGPKVRIVAKGFRQVPVVDYNET